MATTTTNRQSTTRTDRADRTSSGGTWRSVAGWQAFERLAEFHSATDPTYDLLRRAGYEPDSIASFRVEEARSADGDGETTACSTNASSTTAAERTARQYGIADFEAICTRCAVDDQGRPTNTACGTVWVAGFHDREGRRFVHVDRAGCDQGTVGRYFGTGCGTN